MDTLTHALAGALLARATAPATARPGALPPTARVLAGGFAAAFPDIDFVLGYVSPVVYLEHHRGITHSILLLPAWALVVAWLCALAARDSRGIGRWYPVCMLGIASHIALDLITSFGTMILAPVSKERFAFGTTFIIDLWFSGIILAGLAASWYWRRTRVPAVLASLALAGYVGLQAIAKAEAERFGTRHAQALGLTGAQVEAHPRPVSPLNWTVFVTSGERIAYAHVNLLRRKPRPEPDDDAGLIERLNAPYRPLADAYWKTRLRYGADEGVRELARSAWNAKALGFFRWFAQVPAFDGISDDGACVWFRDLRFDTPGRGGTVPFRYGVCRNGPTGRWQLGSAGRL
jgi:inner membrane protein